MFDQKIGGFTVWRVGRLRKEGVWTCKCLTVSDFAKHFKQGFENRRCSRIDCWMTWSFWLDCYGLLMTSIFHSENAWTYSCFSQPTWEIWTRNFWPWLPWQEKDRSKQNATKEWPMKVKSAPVGLDAVVPALTQTVERLESFQRKGIHQPQVGENGQRGGDISTVAELLEKARSLSVPQVQGMKPKRSAEKLGQAAVAVSLRQRLVDFEQLAPQNLRDDAEATRQSTLSLLSYWRKEVSCQEALNRDDSKAVLGRVLERTILGL